MNSRENNTEMPLEGHNVAQQQESGLNEPPNVRTVGADLVGLHELINAYALRKVQAASPDSVTEESLQELISLRLAQVEKEAWSNLERLTDLIESGGKISAVSLRLNGRTEEKDFEIPPSGFKRLLYADRRRIKLRSNDKQSLQLIEPKASEAGEIILATQIVNSSTNGKQKNSLVFGDQFFTVTQKRLAGGMVRLNILCRHRHLPVTLAILIIAITVVIAHSKDGLLRLAGRLAEFLSWLCQTVREASHQIWVFFVTLLHTVTQKLRAGWQWLIHGPNTGLVLALRVLVVLAAVAWGGAISLYAPRLFARISGELQARVEGVKPGSSQATVAVGGTTSHNPSNSSFPQPAPVGNSPIPKTQPKAAQQGPRALESPPQTRGNHVVMPVQAKKPRQPGSDKDSRVPEPRAKGAAWPDLSEFMLPSKPINVQGQGLPPVYIQSSEDGFMQAALEEVARERNLRLVDDRDEAEFILQGAGSDKSLPDYTFRLDLRRKANGKVVWQSPTHEVHLERLSEAEARAAIKRKMGESFGDLLEALKRERPLTAAGDDDF